MGHELHILRVEAEGALGAATTSRTLEVGDRVATPDARLLRRRLGRELRPHSARLDRCAEGGEDQEAKDVVDSRVYLHGGEDGGDRPGDPLNITTTMEVTTENRVLTQESQALALSRCRIPRGRVVAVTGLEPVTSEL